MSIEAEFIVNLGPYEHVKLMLSDDNLMSIYGDSKEPFDEWLGDYHASLKAAVLYGRDRALLNVSLAAGIEQAKAGETHDLGDFSKHPEDAPEEAQEDPVELLKEELGATVLEVREKPADVPSSPAKDRPWSKKPAAKKVKEWEKAPAEEPEPAKVKKNAAAASEWDF